MFGTDQFKKWAREKVVLVQLDFPRKTQLSDKLKKQNNALKSKFGVTGFPSIYFVDAKENRIGSRYGYIPGGPAKWIEGAESHLK